MRPAIVPIEFFITVIHFIAVVKNFILKKVNGFKNTERNILVKIENATNLGRVIARSLEN